MKSMHSRVVQCLILLTAVLATMTAGSNYRLEAQQAGLPPEVVHYADVVLYDGKILTVDENFTIADAVAIRDGKFLAVGTTDRVLPLAGPKTRRIDLKGKMALPGFVDVICELRRFSPEQADDTRRVLKGLARFDETLPETVIELRDDGYHVVGSKADARQLDRIAVIEQILVDSETGLTSEDVLHAWPEHEISCPGKRSVQTDLNYGFSENRWNRSGEGKKGDPFRYSKCDSRTL